MTLEQTRLRIVLVTLAITVGGSFLAWLYRLGWRCSTVLTLAVIAILAVHAVKQKDRLMALLGLAGLVAGFAELFTDSWAITHFGALFYPQGEPMIWASPFYMPFAWGVIVVQLGVIGMWFTSKFGLTKAALLTAAFGGVNIPLYEYLAKGANLWHYENCRMLLDTTPYFIIIFEILISAPLPALVARLEKGCTTTAVVLGLAEGAWMWIALLIGWGLAGPIN